ncbi:carbohydrate esterase family 4 protein [Hypoxylon sp. FL1284]|nr:carbohydrate esterase family 4 protein [Hypoxylon sp. FL1284]
MPCRYYTSQSRRTIRLTSRSDKPRGPDLFDMPRDRVGNVPYGGPGITECANPGQIALTFDDGPWLYTKEVLDELDKYNVKATFFVTGKNRFLNRQIDDESTEWPDMVRDIYGRGHQIGAHTWTHPHMEQINRTERVAEMVYNEMALRNVLGVVPTYMRLPYGGPLSEEVVADVDGLGYHMVQWNVDTKDYSHDSEADISTSIAMFDEAIGRNGTGSYIVLSHDVHEWTAKMLVTAMLDMVAARGYEAVTVGDCLNDPREFWYRSPEKDDLTGRSVKPRK